MGSSVTTTMSPATNGQPGTVCLIWHTVPGVSLVDWDIGGHSVGRGNGWTSSAGLPVEYGCTDVESTQGASVTARHEVHDRHAWSVAVTITLTWDLSGDRWHGL